ncbi:MAG TPA: ShlB/FhaC/HecB family hemolysin secretion/activation protein [Gammaproteobacteria bacterium]|nr:ShlB/FhaC/HecB family hemolysin secretion/activation protein [Gammaproteobacteria bacterium]
MLTAGAATAAPVPSQLNPGALQQQQLQRQRQLERRKQQPRAQEPVIYGSRPSTGTPGGPPGPHFMLRGVEFNRSHFLSKKTLTRIARSYVGHEVDFADLRRLVASINGLYRRRGIITAQAVLPPQKIHAGVVRIRLVEGRVGKVSLKGNTFTRNGYILDRVHLRRGTVVDVAQLRDSLVYFNRTNDIDLKATLRPGARFGLTDVLLQAQEPPRYRLQVFADNEAPASTGRNEIGAYLQVHGLAGMGDRLNLYLTKSRGATNGNLSYSIAVNRAGGRAGLSYARNSIHVIDGAYQPLDITGNSRTLLASYSQPLKVAGPWKITAAGSLSRTVSKTYLAGVFLSDTRVDKLALGLTVENLSRIQYWTLTQTLAPARAHEAVSDRHLMLYDGTGRWLRRLNARWSVVADGGWQYTGQQNLPASELFQIGGATTVRGYRQGIVAGDKGYYLDLELHRRLPWSLDGFTFVDTGAVYTRSASRTSITGAGVGVSWNWKRRVTLDADVGYAVNRVIPNQDSYRFDVRLTVHFAR